MGRFTNTAGMIEVTIFAYRPGILSWNAKVVCLIS